MSWFSKLFKKDSPSSVTHLEGKGNDFPDSVIVPSASDPSLEYTVNLKKITCTCPDWIKRRSNYPLDNPERICKHLMLAAEPDFNPETIRAIARAAYSPRQAHTKNSNTILKMEASPDMQTIIISSPGQESKTINVLQAMAQRDKNIDAILLTEGSIFITKEFNGTQVRLDIENGQANILFAEDSKNAEFLTVFFEDCYQQPYTNKQEEDDTKHWRGIKTEAIAWAIDIYAQHHPDGAKWADSKVKRGDYPDEIMNWEFKVKHGLDVPLKYLKAHNETYTGTKEPTKYKDMGEWYDGGMDDDDDEVNDLNFRKAFRAIVENKKTVNDKLDDFKQILNGNDLFSEIAQEYYAGSETMLNFLGWNLTSVKGLGPKGAKQLIEAGLPTLLEAAKATDEQLLKITPINPKLLTAIRQRINELQTP